MQALGHDVSWGKGAGTKKKLTWEVSLWKGRLQKSQACLVFFSSNTDFFRSQSIKSKTGSGLQKY